MSKKLRKSIRAIRILLLLITFLFTLSGFSSAWAQPKNIIILIGDGMGFEHVKAAGMYANGSEGTLLFESFPYQSQVMTYSADSSITDSAAAGTAIATGTKVNNEVVSVAIPGNGSDLVTLLEYFKNSGKRTGLVTTDTMTGATPACFGAHNASRSNTTDIANDYLTQTKPNILFGGGGNGMSESAAQAAGYMVVTDRSGLQALDTESATMVSGQFGIGSLPYEYDGSYLTLPHLSEMTVTALAVLDNDPADGFFLMVEGARIDHAGHSNNINRTIYETKEFNNTV
jgi:alkaline phosphatase